MRPQHHRQHSQRDPLLCSQHSPPLLCSHSHLSTWFHLGRKWKWNYSVFPITWMCLLFCLWNTDSQAHHWPVQPSMLIFIFKQIILSKLHDYMTIVDYQYVPTPKAEIPLAPHIPQYLLFCCSPSENTFSFEVFDSQLVKNNWKS